MKTQIQSLTFAAMMAGALILPRTSFAGDLDHAAMAAKYTKLAATQQSVIDDGLKLKAENKVLSAKAAQSASVALSNHGYDVMIDAASKEKAELERFARWHQLEAAGAGSKVDGLIAEQQTIIADSQKAKAEARKGYVNDKVTPSSLYAESDRVNDGQITAATAELSTLQGYAEWHKLASTSAASEVAQLTSDQQALVAEHTKMKAENRAGFVNEKVTPSSRYTEMDKHCDNLINNAEKQLAVLKELAQN